MSEREQESQLSALFDGELPPGQAEMVVRRALKDPALRATWGRYALIGACVRNEPVARQVGRPDLAARVQAALAAEPEYVESVAPAKPEGGRRYRILFGRGAMGGAIAAGVAAVSMMIFRSVGPDSAEPGLQVAQVAPPVSAEVQALPQTVSVSNTQPARLVANDSAPRSYTTPVDNSPQRINRPLSSLVVAHSEVAAATMRIVPLGGAMGSGYDLTQGAVDMTEAEIGAYR